MYGKLVAFRVYKNNIGASNGKTVLNRFVQKFYGQTVSSHGGRYVHHVRGLLEDVAHVKLVRSVIIVRESDLERVLCFLAEYGAEVYIRDVVLSVEDEKVLMMGTE
ncbi:MAG: hypothetical protein FWH37_05375 [Candidatus Bathyarchaeota archaeon]|nr:hypothetical protein [Candidatus Termiticorpusculum sp.]